MQPDKSRRVNRLAGATSPYLLQHASNPVDWRPWGAEAHAEARRRDVPIFLSIGYSTCYWCHVMERESFEDGPTAGAMNERFVCVKVDREERPDLDDIYMAATQIMTGAGGWPMSVFLEPERLRPFFCGTYFPREARHGLPSFRQVLEGIGRAWSDQHAQVLEQAEALAQAVREHLAGTGAPTSVGSGQVAAAIEALLTTHDRVNGGFGGAPKFPQPVYLELLLEFLPHAGDEATRAAVEAALRLTLDRMALGGVFDQVGGGFHRYSVDAVWLVPHFEKMLYDNAQLAPIYARAARALDEPFYAGIARRTLDYVLREMVSPEGGFFSAQDAEVDGHEGANYVWTPEQIRGALPPDEAALALRVYGLDEGPNFRDPHQPDAGPSNVLRLGERPESTARRLGLEAPELRRRIASINERLYAARLGRDQPRVDDKILCGWNGLMIGALARAHADLGEPRYREAGERAARFILGALRAPGDGLFRSWRAGTPAVPAFLEDHAMLAHGLIALHRCGTDAPGPFLDEALRLVREASQHFGDGAGGFHDTRADQLDLFVRPRSTYDGATPSGGSMMLHVLLDLAEIMGRPEHVRAAGACLASLSAPIARSPVSAANSTRGLLRLIVSRPESLAALFPQGAPAPARPGTEPVEILANGDGVRLGPAESDGLVIRLRIAAGYHVTAAEPGPAGASLIPLRIGVMGGAGVSVYAEYPAGEPYGPNDELRVYRGDVEIPIVIERDAPPAAWSGRPRLVVTYQACTETECLNPRTVVLDVALEPAP